MQGEEVSIEELASNLSTYKEQLHQVRQLLVDDPENSEYVDMEKELIEVIFSYDCLFVVGSLFSCRFSLEMIAQCLYGFIFPFCVVYCSYGLYSCLEENGQLFLCHCGSQTS